MSGHSAEKDAGRAGEVGVRPQGCRWSDARQRWEVEILPGVSKEACGHEHPRTPLAWCRCGRTIYWCRCADPKPETERQHRMPCEDAFCETCWEAGER